MTSLLKGVPVDSSIGKKWLINSIDSKVKAVDLCSAYIKENSLKYFIEEFKKNNYTGKTRILSRWQAGDLINLSSDIYAYEYAKKNDIDFYILNNFHGKIYKVEGIGILIGSANLTMSGFGIASNGNEETCVLVDSTIAADTYFKNLFQISTLLNDQLYQDISDFIKKISKDFKGEINHSILWPEKISNQFKHKANTWLLCDQMFFCSFEDFLLKNCDDINYKHDLSLLGIEESSNTPSHLKKAFERTKVYEWLINCLKDNNKQIHYGSLSSILHDAIVDDPSPYRKDVKKLLSNLLSWAKNLVPEYVVISRPNYSEKIVFIGD